MGNPLKMTNLIQAIRGRFPQTGRRGQSFLELALILPVLLIMLLGLVEVVIFIGRYLDLLDLTREAARFASVRDPDPNTFTTGLTQDCGNPNYYNFFYSSACIFSPPNTFDTGESSTACPPDLDSSRQVNGSAALNIAYSSYCNGLNPYVYINPTTDDVVITAFTVTSDRTVTNPADKTCPSGEDQCVTNNEWNNAPWALSDHDSNTTNNANWTKDCHGNVVRDHPYYTVEKVNDLLTQNNLLPGRGYVAIEVFYCYHQVLGVPLFTQFVPDPIQIHAYTIMPLPAAQPTPTPDH
jgi:Flp pilus assembly protein TadG